MLSLLAKAINLNIEGINPKTKGINKEIPKLIKVLLKTNICVFLNIVKKIKSVTERARESERVSQR